MGNEGSGGSELFYNFNMESVWMPATALAVEGVFPAGEHSRGMDVTTKLILYKMPLVRTTLLHRLHLNLPWTYNGGKDEEERRNIFKGILGFSMRVGRDMTFIVDYIRSSIPFRLLVLSTNLPLLPRIPSPLAGEG